MRIQPLQSNRTFGILLILFMWLLSCTPSKSLAASPCAGDYSPQSSSAYILPYAVGKNIVVGQGNCTDGSHEINTFQAYAYDFDMPMGTAVVASRAGVVIKVVSQFADNTGVSGEENIIIIRHSDTRISGYYHLRQNSVLVGLGSTISQGQLIAKSGNSGDSSAPHLHFEVAVCEDCDTLPITFRNTRSHSNGLIEGQSYTALPFTFTLSTSKTVSLIGALFPLLEWNWRCLHYFKRLSNINRGLSYPSNCGRFRWPSTC